MTFCAFQLEARNEEQLSKDGQIKVLKTRLDEKEAELSRQQQARIAQLDQVSYHGYIEY